MKILKVEDDERGRAGHFIIWVWVRDDAIHWKQCPYTFKYEAGLVYFLFGGQESSKRLIDDVQSKDDAVKKAATYLDGWLRECGAID